MSFGISARILTYQSGFCTGFHCSTNPFVPSSTAVQTLLYLFHCSSKKYFFVSSVHPISSIHDPTRRPPGVCLAARATVVVTRSPSAWRCCQRDKPSVFAIGMRAARRASRCGMRLPRPTQPSARARSTSTDDISVYKHCCIRDARAHPECNLSLIHI